MPDINKKYLVISGATATGKTGAAIKLAKTIFEEKKVKTEIVNFDSLLFYKSLNIGTAKPSKEELQEVKHHLINISDYTNPLNASRFVELCEPCLEDIWSRGSTPILVGGSGFYLKALEEGMFSGGTPSSQATEKVKSILDNCGVQGVKLELEKYDKDSALKIHENDEYRLTRALEFYFHTGEPISKAALQFEKEKETLGLGLKRKAQGLHFNLEINKPEHYPIVCERTKNMLKNGLVKETEEILSRPETTGTEKPLLSIGYKQSQMFLSGEITSAQDLEERINIATRQLAKAQRTWFNL